MGSIVNTIRPYAPNLLINGGFDFWQRGTSVSSASASMAYRGVDRWVSRPGGSPSGTISRDTDTPNSTIPWSIKTVGTGGSSTLTFYQKIEADAIKPYIGQTMTFSIWMKQTLNNGYTLKVVVPVSGVKDSWAADIPSDTIFTSTTLSFGTNVWTQVSLTFVVPSSAQFGMAVAFEGTAANGLTVWAAGAMLTQGAFIPPYFYRQGTTLQQELALCQRYYEKSYDVDVAPTSVSNPGAIRWKHAGSSGPATFPVRFSVSKRATPSVAVYSVATGTSGQFRNASAGSDQAATVTAGVFGQTGFEAETNATGTGDQIYMYHYSADSEL